jgi:2'-5' RNA ligase
MRIYEQLWGEAQRAFERGEPQMDPHLPDPANDPRRGVTLTLWLPETVRQNIREFLDRLALEFPGQYFYQPEQMHVTVLTMVPGSEFWRREIRDVRPFRQIIRQVLLRHGPFEMEFRGVTAAPNAVLIQGFPLDDGLEQIRSDVRRAFAEAGFAGRLDRRYPNSAAHVSAMRFCNPQADWRRLAERLSENRRTPFGKMRVNTLQVVWSDWYACRLRVLEEYRLPGVASLPVG